MQLPYTILGNYTRRFKGVSRKFQENFKGVSKKFHVAWHSSQLPEQKEGLLDNKNSKINKNSNYFNVHFRIVLVNIEAMP